MQYKCNGNNRENRVKGQANHSTNTIGKQKQHANVKGKMKKKNEIAQKRRIKLISPKLLVYQSPINETCYKVTHVKYYVEQRLESRVKA